MLRAIKKMMGLAQAGKDKKMEINFKFMGEIDKDLFEFEKKLYSMQEAVKYLKELQSQLTSFQEVELEKINDNIRKKYNRIFEMFDKDNKNLLIDEDHKIRKDLKLQTVVYEDSRKNKFILNDIDKDLKKYKNPFNIKKIIEKSRVS